MNWKGLGAALVFGLITTTASATDFKTGRTAYSQGDYTRSFEILRPLALKGNANAAFFVGRHYQMGQGVKKNLSTAWFWYKRAESVGHTEAGLFRHILETQGLLTGSALTTAKNLYESWKTGSNDADTSTMTARVVARPRLRPNLENVPPGDIATTDRRAVASLGETPKNKSARNDRDDIKIETKDKTISIPKLPTLRCKNCGGTTGTGKPGSNDFAKKPGNREYAERHSADTKSDIPRTPPRTGRRYDGKQPEVLRDFKNPPILSPPSVFIPAPTWERKEWERRRWAERRYRLQRNWRRNWRQNWHGRRRAPWY